MFATFTKAGEISLPPGVVERGTFVHASWQPDQGGILIRPDVSQSKGVRVRAERATSRHYITARWEVERARQWATEAADLLDKAPLETKGRWWLVRVISTDAVKQRKAESLAFTRRLLEEARSETPAYQKALRTAITDVRRALARATTFWDNLSVDSVTELGEAAIRTGGEYVREVERAGDAARHAEIDLRYHLQKVASYEEHVAREEKEVAEA